MKSDVESGKQNQIFTHLETITVFSKINSLSEFVIKLFAELISVQPWKSQFHPAEEAHPQI